MVYKTYLHDLFPFGPPNNHLQNNKSNLILLNEQTEEQY